MERTLFENIDWHRIYRHIILCRHMWMERIVFRTLNLFKLISIFNIIIYRIKIMLRYTQLPMLRDEMQNSYMRCTRCVHILLILWDLFLPGLVAHIID